MKKYNVYFVMPKVVPDLPMFLQPGETVVSFDRLLYDYVGQVEASSVTEAWRELNTVIGHESALGPEARDVQLFDVLEDVDSGEMIIFMLSGPLPFQFK